MCSCVFLLLVVVVWGIVLGIISGPASIIVVFGAGGLISDSGWT